MPIHPPPPLGGILSPFNYITSSGGRTCIWRHIIVKLCQLAREETLHHLFLECPLQDRAMES